MIDCPACGATPPADARVCPFCGKRLPLRPQKTLFGQAGGLSTIDSTKADSVRTLKASSPLETLVGVVTPFAREPEPEPEPVSSQKTLFGLPAIRPIVAAAPERPTPLPDHGAAASRTRPLEATRTLAGQAMPELVQSLRTAAAAAERGGRTVQTQALPKPEPKPEPGPKPPAALDPPSRSERRAQRGRRLAEARVAAESAGMQATAARRRVWAPVLALFVVAGLAIGALALLSKGPPPFTARIDGEVAMVRTGDALRASGQLKLSGPAAVSGPGFEARLDGRGPFELSVPAADLKLGTTALKLIVTPDVGEPVQLTVAVKIHYRLSVETLTAPKSGGRIHVEVQVLPGWKVGAAGATAERLSADRFRLGLDAAPLLEQVDMLEGPTGELSFELQLTDPSGAHSTFQERIIAPLPRTRLTVWRPLFGQVQTGPKVSVEGTTTPAAQVRVGAVSTVADEQGRFSLEAELPAEGAELTVVSDASQKLPVTGVIDTRRLSQSKFDDMTTQLGIGAPKSPRYRTLLGDLGRREGELVKMVGRIAGQRRGRKPGTNLVQLSTCRRGNRCPVWVETKGPVWVDGSGRATAIGRLAGLKSYANRAGQTVEAPRIIDATLLPWR